jgi:nicotinamide mononucleotide (NMN) deamidase PncC
VVRRPGRTPGGPAASESGFALLVALFAVFMVGVALSLLALSLAVRMRMAREEARGMMLSALCDAAVAETLSGIAAGQVRGVGEHPFGNGTIGSEVRTLAAQHYQITAKAHVGGKARSVRADVVRDVQGTRVVHWQRVPG